MQPNGEFGLRRAGPLYLTVRRWIVDAVDSGAIEPGDALPSQRKLAALMEMSRATVRKAVCQLVHEGVLSYQRGTGTIVSEMPRHFVQTLGKLTSVTEDMTLRGIQPRSVWLDRGLYSPSLEEMVALGLFSTDGVARLARVRLSGDIPLALERAALPASILPNPDQVLTSLYLHLESTGNRPVRAIQRVHAACLAAEDAVMLGVEPGNACLRIERTSYLASGRVVEFTRSIYRGDAFDLIGPA